VKRSYQNRLEEVPAKEPKARVLQVLNNAHGSKDLSIASSSCKSRA
jgi:hypothetical protein